MVQFSEVVESLEPATNTKNSMLRRKIFTKRNNIGRKLITYFDLGIKKVN